MNSVLGACLGIANGYEPGDVRPFYRVARPGFWGGFGSFLDMFTPLYWNYNVFADRNELIDAEVYVDWVAVGNDLRCTLSRREASDSARVVSPG